MSAIYEERKKQVLQHLSQNGKLSLQELQDIFQLSPATIRRMCASLEADGSVIRVRGGIRIASSNTQTDYSFEHNSVEYASEKIRIAEAVCRSIHDNQSVFLESGTTVYQCALCLADRIQNHLCKNITVFTNSLNNLYVLAPVTQVSLIGGGYRSERQDFVGHLTERFLQNLYFDHAIIGVDGISQDSGLMVMDFNTAHIDERLLGQSSQVTVVAHSGKFDKRSLLSFATLDDVSRIVTDSRLTDEQFRAYSQHAAELIRA
ncbi:MAG: DeoR/GlpR transcriptional regulator [Eubacterium sp.]|nr:DeoR/GlpR transcriptional regulator [Eubacterium sp.]